jgi:hypothetical protein
MGVEALGFGFRCFGNDGISFGVERLTALRDQTRTLLCGWVC